MFALHMVHGMRPDAFKENVRLYWNIFLNEKSGVRMGILGENVRCDSSLRNILWRYIIDQTLVTFIIVVLKRKIYFKEWEFFTGLLVADVFKRQV